MGKQYWEMVDLCCLKAGNCSHIDNNLSGEAVNRPIMDMTLSGEIRHFRLSGCIQRFSGSDLLSSQSV